MSFLLSLYIPFHAMPNIFCFIYLLFSSDETDSGKASINNSIYTFDLTKPVTS